MTDHTPNERDDEAHDDEPGNAPGDFRGEGPTSGDSGQSLLRSNAVVALGTGLSRLTGMLKIIVFGFVIGQTALADAYDGANNSPNSVYELLLGGVLSAALVPMFTRLFENEDEESVEAVVSVSIVFLTAITAIAVY
ncbi:MAG: hypothetical protein RIS33_215, partial [Actinomycetota bacterium]